MDFSPGVATLDAFTARHHHLSTSPESSFVRTSAVYRRDAGGVDALIGCVLRRIEGGRRSSREIESEEEWFGVVAELFGLPLGDLDPGRRAELFRRVRATHEAWRASTTGS